MLRIVDAGLESIPLIRELTFRVWPQTYRGLLSDEQINYMLEMMYSESSLKKQINEGAQFIIVYDGNEPVGFASYQEIKPAIYKLHKIYILSNHQGKGTGRLVMDQVIDRVKTNSGIILQLQVNKNNKAKSFYEKLGFVEVDTINLDIGNGYFMDDYIMEKKITVSRL